MRMRHYVIIGMQPDGEPVIVTHITSEAGYRLYPQEIIRLAFARFLDLYPMARPVKPTTDTGSGGCGWSEPYEVDVERS